MKFGTKFFIAAFCVVTLLSSCEKISVEDDNEMPSIVDGSAKLNIITRGGTGDEDNVVADGRIYIFNTTGKCVQLLSINEESDQTTIQLAPGSYTLYAVGGDDLSRFSLPTASEATPTSVIKLLDGKMMDDLLMASANVELENGETLNQKLVLKHKVICVDEIEIKQIPLTATKVEVSLSPLYNSVQLNGVYPSESTESYKFTLEKEADGDGKTWKIVANQMLFPSKGNPTIKVAITTDDGTVSYSYNAVEELPANYHITIVGTYVERGVAFTGILTDGGWEGERTITFDFDDEDQVNPIAGHFFKGYYVVSVDEANSTAVLFSSRPGVDYVVPSSNAPVSSWLQALNTALAAHEKPTGLSCGEWRLPTVSEAELIIHNPDAIYYDRSELPYTSVSFFCLDGNTLKWAEGQTNDYVNYTFLSGTSGFVSGIYLLPAIDITY